MFCFFSISISQKFKISLSISICDNKFLCLIVFRFFGQIGILLRAYGLIFANSANNTAIIRNFWCLKYHRYRFIDINKSNSFICLNFILCWLFKKNSDLCNLLHTNSYTNIVLYGIQYTDIYANLRQPNMGKINCLKTNLIIKNINTNINT